MALLKGKLFAGALFAGSLLSFNTALPVIAASGDRTSIRSFDYDDYVWARVERKKEIEDIIEQVALRQSEYLQTDQQKIYDELSRELELKGLEFKAIHPKALNYRREQLINAEMGKLIKKRIQEEDEMLLMLIAMTI